MLNLALITWFTGLIIRICAALALPLRHPPAVAMAWLMPIMLWPLPGALAYSMMGSRLLPSKRISRYQRASKLIADRAPDTPALYPRLNDAAKNTVALAKGLNHLPLVGGNSVELLPTAESFFSALLKLINRAERQLWLLYYITDDTGPVEPVMTALKAAAARGVDVRFCADSVGSRKWLSKGAKDLQAAGVTVQELLPVSPWRRGAARFDLRNHRKLAVADGKWALCGSHNLIDPTYGHKNLLWQDLSMAFEGPVAAHLAWIWLNDWYAEGGTLAGAHQLGEQTEPAGDVSVQVLPSGPYSADENFLLITLSALHSAQKCVTITTPYFVPDESLLQAFRVLRARGVEVRLLVPERCDQKLPGLAAQTYYAHLLDMGVQIWLYNRGLLHAKTMTVDDHLAFAGSNNFDMRSFALNFELTVAFTDGPSIEALKTQQEHWLKDCTPLSLKEWQRRSPIKSRLAGLTKLLSPLL